MDRTCVIFTDHFPFGKGETFLEHEIDFISAKFKEVIIFSLDSKNNGLRRHQSNVRCFGLGLHSEKNKKIKKTIHGLFFKGLKIYEKNISNLILSIYSRGGVSICLKKIKKIIIENKINFKNCIFYSYWFGITALIASLVREKYCPNSVFISRAHGVDLYKYRHKNNFIPFQKYLIEHTDYIFPISKDGEEYFKKEYPDYDFKIQHQYLGTINQLDATAILQPKANDVFSFVTCSNLIPLKRVELFAKSFVLFEKKHKNTIWYCIGDGENMSKIKQIIEENNLTSKVVFLGRITNKEVLDFYTSHKIDVFVNCSIFEGIPVSIMEAMSCGIICVATNVGGTKEIVEGSGGVIVPKEITDTELFYVFESLFLLDDSTRKKIQEKSYHIWKERFNANKNYVNWSDLLFNLSLEKKTTN